MGDLEDHLLDGAGVAPLVDRGHPHRVGDAVSQLVQPAPGARGEDVAAGELGIQRGDGGGGRPAHDGLGAVVVQRGRVIGGGAGDGGGCRGQGAERAARAQGGGRVVQGFEGAREDRLVPVAAAEQDVALQVVQVGERIPADGQRLVAGGHLEPGGHRRGQAVQAQGVADVGQLGVGAGVVAVHPEPQVLHLVPVADVAGGAGGASRLKIARTVVSKVRPPVIRAAEIAGGVQVACS